MSTSKAAAKTQAKIRPKIRLKSAPSTMKIQAILGDLPGAPERAPFFGQGVPWWLQETNPNAAIRDYLRVCPVLAPSMLGILFGGIVNRRHLQDAVGIGQLVVKNWHGKEVFWLTGHPGIKFEEYSSWGWDPLLGPFALRMIAQDMLGRRQFQSAALYLGSDVVDWMNDFLEPKGIPRSWSNEVGNGGGMVYGRDPQGNHEVAVVLPAREQLVEASFRTLFGHLAELFSWLYFGLNGAKLTLRIVWLMPSYSDCPGDRHVAAARDALKRVWGENKVVRFWGGGGREVVLDCIRLGEIGLLVPKKAPGMWRLYDIPPGRRSLQVQHP